MGKDFLKFMVLVVVIYLGFLTTFSLVARDAYSLNDMAGSLTRIFFGSSGVGFDIMHNIDPIFGPPLMIVFVMLSSILLTGSLTGMLSNSFSRVITHAREEYLYVYSVYVLEASTSNRLTHFYPPFNLLALVIFRPLRLFLPSDNKFRKARILLLKATHLPIVATIEFYEWLHGTAAKGTQYTGFRGPRHATIASPNPARRLQHQHQHQQHHHAQPLPSSSSPLTLPRPPPPQATASTLSTLAMMSTEPSVSSSSTRHEPSPEVEDRIAALSAKIDRLTDLVVALQAKQNRGLSDVHPDA